MERENRELCQEGGELLRMATEEPNVTELDALKADPNTPVYMTVDEINAQVCAAGRSRGHIITEPEASVRTSCDRRDHAHVVSRSPQHAERRFQVGYSQARTCVFLYEER